MVVFDDAFEKIILPKLKSVNADIKTIYDFFKWPDARISRKVIDELVKNNQLETFIDVVQDLDKDTQTYYLDQLERLDFVSGKQYDKDSFGSKAIQLALSIYDSPAESFSPKVYFNGKCIRDYSVSNCVRCIFQSYDLPKIVILSLARLLPSFANQSDSIEQFIELFSYKVNLDRLFITNELSVDKVWEQLSKDLKIPPCYFSQWNVPGNASQFLFTTFYLRHHKHFNGKYVPCINLGNQSKDFIDEMMDILFENDLSIMTSPFTCHLSPHFTNKYFSSHYIHKNEILDERIEAWADNDDKRNYLIKNGVKPNDDIVVSFRKAFVLDEDLSTYESISNDATIASLNFLLSSGLVEFPVTTENRVSFLLQFIARENRSINRTIDINKLQKSSRQTAIPGYSKWHETHTLQIYEHAGMMPMRARLKEHKEPYLVAYRDGDYYYDSYSQSLYINNEVDREDILFRIARTPNSGINLDDWYSLFKEGDKERNAKISKGKSEEIGGKERIEAQIEAQRFLKDTQPLWQFPEHYGEVDDEDKPYHFSTAEIIDENGTTTSIVLKSHKKEGEPLKINPTEWRSISGEKARIFVYTGDNIKEIDVKDLVRNQSKVSISFSTENLNIEERIDAFADSLRYFKELHFDLDSFNLSKQAKSLSGMYNVNDRRQGATSDNDL